MFESSTTVAFDSVDLVDGESASTGFIAPGTSVQANEETPLPAG